MPIREIVKKITECLLGSATSTRYEDAYKPGYPKGEIFWRLEDTITGEVTTGKLSNTVVLDAGILIARFFKGTASPIAHQSEPSFGVLALAMGTGNVSWDVLNPPAAKNTQRSLWNELGRKQIQSAQFVDGDGNISSIPTNIVDFTTTFSESEAVGPLCEMGLLGADISTNMSLTNPVLPPDGPYDPAVDLVGKDTLINYLTFPVISKSSTSVMSWTWRLSF